MCTNISALKLETIMAGFENKPLQLHQQKIQLLINGTSLVHKMTVLHVSVYNSTNRHCATPCSNRSAQ